MRFRFEYDRYAKPAPWVGKMRYGRMIDFWIWKLFLCVRLSA